MPPVGATMLPTQGPVSTSKVLVSLGAGMPATSVYTSLGENPASFVESMRPSSTLVHTNRRMPLVKLIVMPLPMSRLSR
jgi:hypothetical protein